MLFVMISILKRYFEFLSIQYWHKRPTEVSEFSILCFQPRLLSSNHTCWNILLLVPRKGVVDGRYSIAARAHCAGMAGREKTHHLNTSDLITSLFTVDNRLQHILGSVEWDRPVTLKAENILALSKDNRPHNHWLQLTTYIWLIQFYNFPLYIIIYWHDNESLKTSLFRNFFSQCILKSFASSMGLDSSQHVICVLLALYLSAACLNMHCIPLFQIANFGCFISNVVAFSWNWT